ncbi:MAG: hypothetical protein ACP5E3_18170, partial [Bacteroidales bacterium]
SGVNTTYVSIPGNCLLNPEYTVSYGLGAINNYNNDIYIQDESFYSDKYYSGHNIYLGESVTSSKPTGPVIVNSGIKIILDAENTIEFVSGFEVEVGGEIETRKNN